MAGAAVSTASAASAIDSGAATTDPSIMKLIVRPSRSGSVFSWTQAIITTLM